MAQLVGPIIMTLAKLLIAWSNNFEYLSVSGGVALMSWGYISPGEASTRGISDPSKYPMMEVNRCLHRAYIGFYQSLQYLLFLVGVYFTFYLIVHGPQLLNTIHHDNLWCLQYSNSTQFHNHLYDQSVCPVPGTWYSTTWFTQPNHDQDSCTNRKSDRGATPHWGAMAGFTLNWRCLIMPTYQKKKGSLSLNRNPEIARRVIFFTPALSVLDCNCETKKLWCLSFGTGSKYGKSLFDWHAVQYIL